MTTLANPDTVGAILERLGGLRPDTKRQWGRMTAHQMVCHLCDAYRAALGLKPVASATTFMGRYVIRWLAFYSPIPWPKGVPTRPEVDQEIGGTKPVDFDRDVAELRSLIRRFAGTSRGFPPHPTMGPFSEWEWMRWGYLHTNHHFRQFGI